MSLFESVIDMMEAQARMLFVKLQYTLATEEAEKIGGEHFIFNYASKNMR